MIEDICKNMSDALTNAYSSSISLQSKLASETLDSLIESFESFVYELSSSITERLSMNLAAQISKICESMITAIELPISQLESLNFLKELNFQEGYVELSQDDCDSINSILKSPDTSDNASMKVSNGKMAVSDFIKSVLIPILAILLPMLLTIYYHKIDSIESQKRHMEELQLKEEELCIMKQQLQNDIEEKEILENIFIELQNQSEYYEFLQADPECPSEAQVLPAEALKPFAYTQDNDSLSPDASKSSKAATHKE